MKKKALSFYCITLMLFCQILLCSCVAGALSENGANYIIDNCEQIKTQLHDIVKHNDSRARVYIGGYYETFASKYIKPLNLRLTANSITNDVVSELVNNQGSFLNEQINFKDDFIEYQRSLDELISYDCKSDPQGFYQQLVGAREKRQIMVEDINKINSLIQRHIELVRQLKEKL